MSVPSVPEMPAAVAEPSVPSSEPISITWHGSAWSLAGVGLLNTLLTILTLGIYSFWGRTEVRRRIWSMVRMNGEPFAYTGTGKELFIGYLIVFLIITVPWILALTLVNTFATYLFGPTAGPAIATVVIVSYTVFIYLLFGSAVYRARRYRLSRTQWRGIRGTVTGSPWLYGWHYIWTLVANIFAMGWMSPWRSNLLHRQLTNDSRFGETAFKYRGKAGPLYPTFTLAWIGALVGLIVVSAGIGALLYPLFQSMAAGGGQAPIDVEGWQFLVGVYAVYALAGLVVLGFSTIYLARALNYFTSNTIYAGTATFKLRTSAMSLFWQYVSYYLITFLTLGILGPVAQARWIKFVVDRLEVTGGIDFPAIVQSSAALGKRGEGLATAFDVDAFS